MQLTAPMPSPMPAQPAAPPPAQVPPVADYRFLGRMIDPLGTTQVYLARGDEVLQIAVGMRLDTGYVVHAIDDAAVRLHDALLGTTVLVPLPAAPQADAP